MRRFTEIFSGDFIRIFQRFRVNFLDGPGGTGKTFVYNTLINVLRGEGKHDLVVAWTGIAATLLPGGQTCHTAFHLPLDLQQNSTCSLKKKEKELLLGIDVILWDEASMAEKYALEAVDRLLRDVTRNERVPFGGKVVVLGGDFRQILPVVPGGSRAQIISHSVKTSRLWGYFHQFRLIQNMRADPNANLFAEWLLQLGNDQLPPPPLKKTEYSIALPAQCMSGDIIPELFPDQFDGSDPRYHQRVILTPLNEDARLTNELILNRMTGETVTYKSIDTVGVEDNEDPAILQQTYPVEFLNGVQMSGLPPHALNLKKNAVVMMLRNLSIRDGLSNGTRLQIMDMKRHVIKAKILSGAHCGSIHFIPRITLDTKQDKQIPFNLNRRQFPLKLAFSMTINKAQGQKLEKAGIILRNPVFTHGQLYVACSRVRSFDALKIQVIATERQGTDGNTTVTDNIVYKEVL